MAGIAARAHRRVEKILIVVKDGMGFWKEL